MNDWVCATCGMVLLPKDHIGDGFLRCPRCGTETCVV